MPAFAAYRRKPGEKLPPLRERLAKLGLVRDWDFVLHLPLRYEDETAVTPIAALELGRKAQVQATLVSLHERIASMNQLICQMADDSGQFQVRFLHYYATIRKTLEKKEPVLLFGDVREGFNGVKEMIQPRVKKGLVPGVEELPKCLTPVYPAGEGLTQPWLRKRINRALLDVNLTDTVPADELQHLGLPSFANAIKELHHPPAGADQKTLDAHSTPAWQRIKFDEFLAQQITLRHSRTLKAGLTAHPFAAPAAPGLSAQLLKSLPFTLTGAQQRAWQDIQADLARPVPMQRLLQGDVGSGKTVVAALAAARAIESGYQAALMAPTEILAEQHYSKLKHWLEPLGVRIAWLAGSLKPKEKAAMQQAINAGEIDLAIGTHALIQDAVHFPRLGLAIIDEQHRFGVAQRLRLRSSGEQTTPHMLMLSATPIPRTLAMSYLADLDVTVIDELPPGRQPIATKLVSLERIADVQGAVQGEIASGRQIYWVCPLIEESEAAALTAVQTRYAQILRDHPTWRVGLLHGGLTAAQKQETMNAFSAGELDLLVCTTVVEVGVDVPNATLMVIEHAENFGLAQLHQLRGRVGRGANKSFCVLLFDPKLSATAKERLRIIRNLTDGFAIAREDLRLRGPGEFLGARQSGAPMLRFADPQTDGALLDAARSFADRWLKEDPTAALTHAKRWFTNEKGYLEA